MANFNYRSQFAYSYAGQRVTLMAQVGIGASGAPTIASRTGMGISSIVRASAGLYTITFTNPFAKLLNVQISSISGSSAPAAPVIGIVSQAVATSSAPTVVVQMRDLSGVATDPASGEILLVSIDLDRLSVGH
jgi:hypothetical protein